MARAISSLELGSKIKDSENNTFVVVAKNHYGNNQVTLMHTSLNKSMTLGSSSGTLSYATSSVHVYLSGEYTQLLDAKLLNSILTSNIPCNYRSGGVDRTASINTKAFILSATEVGGSHVITNNGTVMNYVKSNLKTLFSYDTWFRTHNYYNSINYFEYYRSSDSVTSDKHANNYLYIVPAFNVPSSLLVTDDPSSGYYRFIFNEPPVIKNISNIKGNYGSKTDITYVATDSDDTSLSHYISFDNGSTYTQINPNRVGDTYTYSHVFNELKTYYCRVKVVDSVTNSVVSNGFTVEVSSVAPVVNIVSVIDGVVTFKASCLTHDMSKVEILINGSIVKTYSSGFDFNLVYEIDRTLLNTGKNSIQIKATSTGDLSTYRDIEANKTTYNLPPVGTKVVIRDKTYTITNAEQVKGNQLYTLERPLETDVSYGEEIRIEQDSVKVLCSLSNLENSKTYKEMELVKTKKLKGQFEGYIEEKYELFGEGRYSAIKIETERFNNDVESEIIELQQYFDYMED